MRLPHSVDKPCVWASLSIALVFAWQSLTVQANYDGNWTGLFRTGSAKAAPDSLLVDTFGNAQPRGYDGRFNRFLAPSRGRDVDPVLGRCALVGA